MKPSLKTFTVEITTKKNTSITCTFAAYQQAPFPRLGGWGLDWQNGDGIFPEYGNKGGTIKPEYRVALLRDDWTPEQLAECTTRHAYAGFEDAPGGITFRGNYLGEMVFTAKRSIHSPDGYCTADLYDTPKAIRQQIETALFKYLKRNEKSLYREAVKGIKQRMSAEIKRVKNRLPKLEAEMKATLEALNN